MAARNIYIYVRYVVTLGLITPRACINVAESAFLKFIFMGQGNSGKNDLLLRSGLEPGSDACIADHCLCHRTNGALAALDCNFGSYTVDCCSEC